MWLIFAERFLATCGRVILATCGRRMLLRFQPLIPLCGQIVNRRGLATCGQFFALFSVHVWPIFSAIASLQTGHMWLIFDPGYSVACPVTGGVCCWLPVG